MNIKYNISKISDISTGTFYVKKIAIYHLSSIIITFKSGTGVGQNVFKIKKGLRDFF